MHGNSVTSAAQIVCGKFVKRPGCVLQSWEHHQPELTSPAPGASPNAFRKATHTGDSLPPGTSAEPHPSGSLGSPLGHHVLPCTQTAPTAVTRGPNHMGKATACQLPPHRRHVHPSEHHPEHQERAQLKQLTSRCSKSLWSSCCFCLRQRRARGSCSGSRCCPQEGTTARLSKQRDSKSLQS